MADEFASQVCSCDSETREKRSEVDVIPNDEKFASQVCSSDSETREKRSEVDVNPSNEKEKNQWFDDDDDDDGCLTHDQLTIYYQMVRDSQGFDVPDFPPSEDFGRIMPITDLNNDLEMFEITRDLSCLAIEEYNVNNGTKYKFDHVEKANLVGVAGYIFYITFEAKDGDDDDDHSKTFQTRVFRGFRGDVEVFSCDPKPT
ncbi:UPF0725 protein At1g23960-like [Cornus florida]|uniref:UPF0725 protein At1g23960-like n=1 Tax=Cornus florida TaxID=4283 RepID=UPI00289CE59C|nr:UPF0725 protein At1g23960-like [Cornus florida]